MPPCPTTDPVVGDDGHTQTAQQRYRCRSVPFPPRLALIEHKADPNYDAVATRMPATHGLAFVPHAGNLVVRAAQAGSPSIARPCPLSVLHTTDREPFAVGPPAVPARPNTTASPLRAQPQQQPQRTGQERVDVGGLEALSTSLRGPPLQREAHRNNDLFAPMPRLSAQPSRRAQCPKNAADTAASHGNWNEGQADPHRGRMVRVSLDEPVRPLRLPADLGAAAGPGQQVRNIASHSRNLPRSQDALARPKMYRRQALHPSPGESDQHPRR